MDKEKSGRPSVITDIGFAEELQETGQHMKHLLTLK